MINGAKRKERLKINRKVKILFIAWDNPKSNYLEGLFAPIFSRLQAEYNYEFHVVQFSWASRQRREFLAEYCRTRGIAYNHFRIITKPFAFLGKFLTVYLGAGWIARYIKHEKIDIVMPRSTMPAKMTLQLKERFSWIKIVFDADGLPIEERVDFAKLKKDSLRFRQLKNIEGEMLGAADIVLTRTEFAADYLKHSHAITADKFCKVINGRDENFFKRDETIRFKVRKELKIPEDAKVITYCGSLGPQYGVDQMLYLHNRLLTFGRYYLLVLTNNPSYLDASIAQNPSIVVMKVPFEDIPGYLSAGDFGLAIRESKFSMLGVAPIKIGEYLLMGMPIVASSGIGDSDSTLSEKDFCFLLKDYSTENLDKAAEWINNLTVNSKLRSEIRSLGVSKFSLSESILSYYKALGKAGL